MILVRGIINTLDTGGYYLLINSNDETVVCEIRSYVAEELLLNNKHIEKAIDNKSATKEFEFLTE